MSPASAYENAIVRYARWVVRARWAVIAVSLLAMAGLASGARLLTFSTDYRVYFGPDNPQLVAFDEFQKIYTRTDSLLFVVEPRAGDVFQPAVLAAVHELTEEAWKLPYTLRVDSIANYQHTEADGDDLKVEALVRDPSGLTPEQVAKVREVALSEPLLVRRLVPPDGRTTAVAVVSQFPQQAFDELPRMVEAARELRARLLAEHPEIGAIYITGSNAMSNAFTEAAAHDMQTLIPAMYGIIVVIMWLLLRSATATLATALIVVFSTVAAMGLAGYAGFQLTAPSATAPQIITTLAVADCIHLYVTMLGGLRAGRARFDAIVESMRLNFTPVLLTSVTTAIGFLAVNFTDSPPLRDLANITAIGVMLAWAFSVFTLPALMAVLPARVPAGRGVEQNWLTHLMDRLGEAVLRRHRPLFWAMAAVSVLFTALAFRNEPNDLFAHYFEPSIEFRSDTDQAVAKLTGFYFIEWSLRADEPGGIADPAYLARVEAFKEWWRTGPHADKVRFVGSITDVFRRLNRNMHGDDPAYDALPRDRELAAQYLLLYEMSLPFGLDLNNQVNVDKSAARFTVLFRHLRSAETRRVEQDARAWLAAQGFGETIGVAPAVMFAYIAERNIESNFLSLPLSLAAISLLLVPALRSLRVSALSLVPNLVPLGIAFGLWFLIDGEIKFTQAIVLNMTIGIIVDDTIHFLARYLRARRELELAPEAAIRYAFHTVGAALVVTTAILVAGFGLLTQSAFVPNSANAALTCIVLVVALVVDLLFLPPLLLRVDRVARAPTEEKESPREPLAEK
jgi:uncharacterized protein